VHFNMIVNCPTCNAEVTWNKESKWRPFCSERCKLIDLGAWADEEYSIASSDPSPIDDIDSDFTELDLIK